MKIVINNQYGGFGLSNKAIKRLAELQGRECYFFSYSVPPTKYELIQYENLPNNSFAFITAFDIPNPNEMLYPLNWNTLTLEEKQEYNKRYDIHSFNVRDMDRHDPLLIQLVEELGEEVNTRYSNLQIIEIPDDADYVIEEYYGLENIAEKCRKWYAK